jgi:hypothetical protein
MGVTTMLPRKVHATSAGGWSRNSSNGGPTAWRSAAASALNETPSKSTDLAREAVSCNAGLGLAVSSKWLQVCDQDAERFKRDCSPLQARQAAPAQDRQPQVRHE